MAGTLNLGVRPSFRDRFATCANMQIDTHRVFDGYPVSQSATRQAACGFQLTVSCGEQTLRTSNKRKMTSLADHGLLSSSKACQVPIWNWLENERCRGQQPAHCRAVHWHKRHFTKHKPAKPWMFHRGSSRGLLNAQPQGTHGVAHASIQTALENA